jgi:hypothetical protein
MTHLWGSSSVHSRLVRTVRYCTPQWKIAQVPPNGRCVLSSYKKHIVADCYIPIPIAGPPNQQFLDLPQGMITPMESNTNARGFQ